MKTFFLFAVLIASSAFYAQNRSIIFETGTYSEALAKAKKENKLIFMDAYTTWCGPCKWMSKNMFTKDEIADYYNKNFINVKMDMEKGEGIDIAKKFEVKCYPNLLFIDGDGNLVHRAAGAGQEIEYYTKLGETAKNPSINFSAIQKKMNTTKNPSSSLIADYINAIAVTCLPYESYVDSYFSIISAEEMTNRTTWNILFNFMNDYKHSSFQYLLKNQAEYQKLYTKDSVEMKISSTFVNSGNEILYAKSFTEASYKDYLTSIDKMNFNGKDAVLFNLNLALLYKKEDFNAIFDYALKNSDFLDDAQTNSICWDVYEKSDKKEHLNKALVCMEKLTSSEAGKNWMYMDTYASLLYKAKNKTEAKKIAEETILLAKKSGVPEEDYKATEELLVKINKLQ